MKIYLLTTGDFSRIVGIFSSRALAEDQRTLYRDANDIEEMELDRAIEHPPGHARFQVTIGYAGGIYGVRKMDPDWPEWSVSDAGRDRRAPLDMTTWAKDDMHATAIARDRRQQLITEEKWDSLLKPIAVTAATPPNSRTPPSTTDSPLDETAPTAADSTPSQSGTA